MPGDERPKPRGAEHLAPAVVGHYQPKTWAGGAYAGEDSGGSANRRPNGSSRSPSVIKGIKGFKVLLRRWIVERTFGRLVRNRRLGKDYERMVQTGEALA
jgi:transposase